MDCMETINLSEVGFENLNVNVANSNYVCPRCEKDSGYHIAKAISNLVSTDEDLLICDTCAEELDL